MTEAVEAPRIRSAAFRIAEETLPGGVEAWMRAQRAAGMSLGDMAFSLRAGYHLPISPQTLSRWCKAFGIA